MIKDLAELKKLLLLCRKQGVTEIEFEGIKLKLGDLPVERSTVQQQEEVDESDPYANFPAGILTPTQLQYYSAGGVPDDDPELKVDQ
jgi:hypothetical protein